MEKPKKSKHINNINTVKTKNHAINIGLDRDHKIHTIKTIVEVEVEVEIEIEKDIK